jgi:cysteine desulfurase
MMIYLDYNASSPLRPSVKDKINDVLVHYGNPSSTHTMGRLIRSLMDQARIQIADFFNVSSAIVFFTSGATESNVMILKSFKGRVIISAIEHDSVRLIRDDVIICPVDANGLLDMNHLESIIQCGDLVCVMSANNETGVLQNMNDIYKITQSHKACLMCDAVQSVGKTRNFDNAFDILTMSGHKLGGLSGVGVSIIKEHVKIQSLIPGGGQERGMRSGTENHVGIIAMAEALMCAANDNVDQWSIWRNQLESTIKSICHDVIIPSENAPRLAQTSCIIMPHVANTLQLIQFDLNKIYVSSGSACSSGKVKPSHVLKAMNINGDYVSNAIRVSFGWNTNQSDIDSFIHVWKTIYTHHNPTIHQKVSSL